MVVAVNTDAPPSPVVSAANASSSSVSAANVGSAVVTTSAAVASSDTEFKGVMLGGNRYLVQLSSGHCYHRSKDGSQGDWAGIFHRNGGPKNGPWIDDAVPEPDADDDDGDADELVFDE